MYLAREPPPVSRAPCAISRTITNQMSDFTCQCTDTMVATCTSSFASAYLCAAVVAIAVVLARVCTCDWSDDSDSDDDETSDAVKSMFS